MKMLEKLHLELNNAQNLWNFDEMLSIYEKAFKQGGGGKPRYIKFKPR